MADTPALTENLHDVGIVGLETNKHCPAYKESLEVYNFTGYDILMCNSDGATFRLPSDDNELYQNKLIVRKQMTWATDVDFVKYLTSSHVPKRIVDALKSFYTKHANEAFNPKAGQRLGMFDIVLDGPSIYAGEAFRCKHTDIIFSSESGRRRIAQLHDERFTKGSDSEELLKNMPVGVIVPEFDSSTSMRFVRLFNMYVSARPVKSLGVTLGAIVCLVTGLIIHDPKEDETAEPVAVYKRVSDALIESVVETEQDFYERPAPLKNIINGAEEEAKRRDSALRDDLNVKTHELKRKSIITDMAVSQLSLEHKTDVDNTKQLLGLLGGLIKR